MRHCVNASLRQFAVALFRACDTRDTSSIWVGPFSDWNGTPGFGRRTAMERLNSIEELRALEERMIADRNPYLPVIVISAGTCGQASGVNDLIRIAKREILANGLAGAVGLRITGCHGFCQAEPSILVEPDGTFYPKLGVNEVAR